MTFDEWWDKQNEECCERFIDIDPREFGEEIWNAAIKEYGKQMLELHGIRGSK